MCNCDAVHSNESLFVGNLQWKDGELTTGAACDHDADDMQDGRFVGNSITKPNGHGLLPRVMKEVPSLSMIIVMSSWYYDVGAKMRCVLVFAAYVDFYVGWYRHNSGGNS